jgi:hypothetical protein
MSHGYGEKLLLHSLVDQVGQETDHQELKAADEGDNDGHQKAVAENNAVEVKDETYFEEKQASRKEDFHGVDI